MRRAAGIALLVVGAAAGRSRAGDDPPSTPPVSLAAWEERDVEGRWVLYRSSQGLKPGEFEDPWIPFLAKRKKFQLLEWISLTSAAPAAVEALAKADAPGWVRCAVWSLRATDSHVGGGAEKWLTEKRPGLALAWFERFPAAAVGPGERILQVLRAKAAKREDASALLPPLEPETVLADLRPPAHLEEWGDRTQAEPGHRYVHQVERAIEALCYTRLEGVPWAGRLAALLSHAHPKVRRAAALAYARRPRREIPVGLLLAQAADEKEAPEVRAAALLGASYSDHPAAYARLLGIATEVTNPLWRAATSRLGDVDDGFAIGHWEALGPARLAGGDKAFAEEQAARIRARVAASDEEAVPRMLERAAWIDLACDPLEERFGAWTRKELRGRLAAPGVRAAVERARDGYEPGFLARATKGPDSSAIRDRVRAYSKDILAGGDTPLGPR